MNTTFPEHWKVPPDILDRLLSIDFELLDPADADEVDCDAYWFGTDVGWYKFRLRIAPPAPGHQHARIRALIIDAARNARVIADVDRIEFAIEIFLDACKAIEFDRAQAEMLTPVHTH